MKRIKMMRMERRQEVDVARFHLISHIVDLHNPLALLHQLKGVKGIIFTHDITLVVGKPGSVCIQQNERLVNFSDPDFPHAGDRQTLNCPVRKFHEILLFLMFYHYYTSFLLFCLFIIPGNIV